MTARRALVALVVVGWFWICIGVPVGWWMPAHAATKTVPTCRTVEPHRAFVRFFAAAVDDPTATNLKQIRAYLGGDGKTFRAACDAAALSFVVFVPPPTP